MKNHLLCPEGTLTRLILNDKVEQQEHVGQDYCGPSGMMTTTVLGLVPERLFRLRRGRLRGCHVGSLAHHFPDQQVPVAFQRGVGRGCGRGGGSVGHRLPAVVVGQQMGQPVVHVRQQAREHLVDLEHADAARVAVALEPVVEHPDGRPYAEQERAQVHVFDDVVPELDGPLGLEQLHVGGQRVELVPVYHHIASVR